MLADQPALPGLDAPARPSKRARVAKAIAVAARRATAGDNDYAAQWERLVAANYNAAHVVVEAARAHVAECKRPSIDAVWNAIRGRVPGEMSNNNLRASAARWLMASFPGLAGKFRIRENAGQVPERAR